MIPLIANPLDGVLPDFTAFGFEFTELWQKLIAALWALGIIIAIVYLISAILGITTATREKNPRAVADARSNLLWAAVALGALAALAVIVGVILTLFS